MAQTGEAVDVTRMSLRGGGWIGYATDSLYIDRDDEKMKIKGEHVRGIALRAFQWDLAIMSALLVAVGGYVVMTRNPLVGGAFAAIGLLSLYRTYAKRYALIIRVENERKPVTVHPSHPVECHETLVETIEGQAPGGAKN
jgi:hypothetical protein